MKAYIRVVLVLCLSMTAAWAGDREVKMTSYFPTPYAAYRNMNVTNELQLGMSYNANIRSTAEGNNLSLSTPKASVKTEGLGEANLNFNNMKAIDSTGSTESGITVGGNGFDNTTANFNSIYIGTVTNEQEAASTAEVQTLKANSFELFGKQLPECSFGSFRGVTKWKKYTDPNGVSRWVIACEKLQTEIQSRSCRRVQRRVVGLSNTWCGTETRECEVGTENCTSWTGECVLMPLSPTTTTKTVSCENVPEAQLGGYTLGQASYPHTETYTCNPDGSAGYITNVTAGKGIARREYNIDECYKNVSVNGDCAEIMGSSYSGSTTGTYHEYATGVKSETLWNTGACKQCTPQGTLKKKACTATAAAVATIDEPMALIDTCSGPCDPLTWKTQSVAEYDTAIVGDEYGLKAKQTCKCVCETTYACEGTHDGGGSSGGGSYGGGGGGPKNRADRLTDTVDIK